MLVFYDSFFILQLINFLVYLSLVNYIFLLLVTIDFVV